MAKIKSFYYIVDKLDSNNSPKLRAAIMAIPDALDAKINTQSGVIEVKANKDIEESIDLACNVVGVVLRTRVNSSQI